MKKLVLTLIATLAICGLTKAQHPETYWPDFSGSAYDFQGSLCASIMIDGEPVSYTYENWQMLEIAAFVGEQQRGADIWLTQEQDAPIPTTLADPVYYNISGEVVTFKMYNHATHVLYEECVTLILGGDPITILTGEEHWEIFEDPEHPLILSFTSPAPQPTEFPLDITGYGEGTGNYYLIASPIGEVSPGAVTNMIPDPNDEIGYDLFYFDQTKELEWVNIKDGQTALQPGKGYLYAREEGATLTFTGTAYSGNGTFDLVYSTTNSDPIMHGWNLVGNPFATTATVNRDCYVMGEGGSEIILSENRSVAAMQGVFVKALETETEPKVTFGQGNSTGDGAKVVLNVRKDRAATIDRAMVRFNDNSSLPKFMLDNSNTKIYIPQNGNQYAVVSGGNENSLPVNFKAKENGTYTLNIEVENVDMDYLHLIDHKTGDDVDLLVNPNYTFQARSTDYAERFTLVYANTTGLEENFAFFNGSKWVIGNEGKATLQIMDVVGRLLSSEQINGCTEISLGQPAGVYVMRLINGDNVKTQKVVVR